MPPKRSSAASTAASHSGNAGSSPEEVRKQIHQDARTRTSQKRQKLHEQYNKEVEELNASIQEIVLHDELELAALREAQLLELKELVTRKSDIETQIFQHNKALEDIYGAAYSELCVVLAAKVEDLENLMGGERDENDEERRQDGAVHSAEELPPRKENRKSDVGKLDRDSKKGSAASVKAVSFAS